MSNRSRRVIRGALVLLFLACPAAASAAPVTVNLRVEGATSTIFEGPVVTDVHQVTTPADGQPRTCDGSSVGAPVRSHRHRRPRRRRPGERLRLGRPLGLELQRLLPVPAHRSGLDRLEQPLPRAVRELGLRAGRRLRPARRPGRRRGVRLRGLRELAAAPPQRAGLGHHRRERQLQGGRRPGRLAAGGRDRRGRGHGRRRRGDGLVRRRGHLSAEGRAGRRDPLERGRALRRPGRRASVQLDRPRGAGAADPVRGERARPAGTDAREHAPAARAPCWSRGPPRTAWAAAWRTRRSRSARSMPALPPRRPSGGRSWTRRRSAACTSAAIAGPPTGSGSARPTGRSTPPRS